MLRDYLHIKISAASRLAVLSGALLIVCQPPVGQFYLAYAALVPLLFAVEPGRGRLNFAKGFLCGVVAYVGLVCWVVVAMNRFGGIPMPLAVATMLLLVLYLSLFTGGFMWVVGFLRDRLDIPVPFSAPSAWVLLEYLRGVMLSGFPWSFLAHSQYNFLPVVQAASVGGAYFISFLIVMVNCLIYTALARKRLPLAYGALTVCLFAACLAFGFYRLGESVKGDMQAAIVQGNVRQDIKYDEAYRAATVNKYANLTLLHSRPSDLVVWPETAMPFVFDPDRVGSAVRALPQACRNTLLFGTISRDARGRYYNTAYAIGKNGEVFAPYSKVHLVPFGEYTPLVDYFPFLADISVAVGDFYAGPSHDPIRTDAGRIGMLICYEGIFPYITRDTVRRGAQVLVNITNDAWFGRSSAPYQHYAAYIFRAVETDRYVLRAANTGISAIIDPRGRTAAETGLFETAVIRGAFGLRDGWTVYVRYGDWFVLAAFIVLAAPVAVRIIGAGHRRQRRRY
jgi:apolipoprotein N-acyltransferase